MAALARDAIEQGALGFTTSRTLNHRTSRGELTPTLTASADELVGIARAIGTTGRGVLQVVSDFADVDDEFALFRRMAEESGRPLSFSLVQTRGDAWRRQLELLSDATAAGVEMRAQVAPRAVGLLLGLQCTLHPLLTNPVYREVADLPLDERVAVLAQPEFRTRVLEAHVQAPARGRARRAAAPRVRSDVRARRPARLRARPGVERRGPGRAGRAGPARPRLRPAARRRRPGDALPAQPQLGRRQPRRRRRDARPPRHRRRASATAARTSAPSATRASPPRCWPGGAATAPTAGRTSR